MTARSRSAVAPKSAASPGSPSATSLAAGDDVVDERLVDRAVEELRRLVTAGQVETAVRVGEYLIQNFYGSVEVARSRAPGKAASLARLAERAEEFGMRASGLRTAVGVSLQARSLGRPLSLKLGITQHRALLPLRDDKEKRLLAEAAVASRWNADEVRARVHRLQEKNPGGRPALPAIERLVVLAARALAKERVSARGEGLAGLTPARSRQLLGMVEAMQKSLEVIERDLVRAGRKAPGTKR